MVAAARERHASQKQQLDTALAGLQGDAQKVPGTVAAAFWLHSDAFKAAATALDNQQQAVLVPTPPPGSPKQSVGSSAQPTGSHHFPTAKVPLPYAAPGPSNLGSRNGSTLNSGVRPLCCPAFSNSATPDGSGGAGSHGRANAALDVVRRVCGEKGTRACVCDARKHGMASCSLHRSRECRQCPGGCSKRRLWLWCAL